MMQKLKQQKGETLIETLLAMLIIVLTVTLLSTCVTTTANINKQTREADERFREQLLEAEGRTGTATPNCDVSIIVPGYDVETLKVTIYGDADSDFISYDYEVSP